MSNVHTFTEKTGLIDEQDIREWFKTVDIEQARDTFRVVEGILEMRAVPKRKRRADAGKPRDKSSDDSLNLFLGGTAT